MNLVVMRLLSGFLFAFFHLQCRHSGVVVVKVLNLYSAIFFSLSCGNLRRSVRLNGIDAFEPAGLDVSSIFHLNTA